MSEWQVHTGDWRDVLPRLEAEGVRVDAVVTDPPYGISAVRGGRCFGTSNACDRNEYRPIHGDDEPFDPEPLLGLAATICLWGANHYADRLPARARWLVWDKRDGVASNPLADCELAWTSDTRPARLFAHRWMGMIRASERGRRVHPAQKPVQLMRWCLDTLGVPEGATVLDPYCGSGSTGVACLRTGRKFIGIEIDPRYADIARKRCEREAAQPMLIGAGACE